MLKDFNRVNEQGNCGSSVYFLVISTKILAMKISDKISQTNSRMASINSTFDKMDLSIVSHEHRTKKIEGEVAQLKHKVLHTLTLGLRDQQSQVRYPTNPRNNRYLSLPSVTLTHIIDELERFKSISDFKVEEAKSKVKQLQDYLVHYTPLQTHIQV